MSHGRTLPARAREGIPGFGRVLHVLNGLPFGGNETLCLQLLAHLPSEERLVLNIGPDGPMREKFQALDGFELFQVEYHRRHRVRFILSLIRLLRRLRPAGVIVYPFGLHVLVALAARLAGVGRVLVHAGNPMPAGEERRRLWRWIVRASLVLRTPIVSCSRYVDQEFRRLNRRIPGGSRAVYNGIDTASVAQRAAAARAARADTRPTVGMVARLSAIKDQETLIRAIARVRPSHPDVQLWIVGDGECRERLEALTDELGLEGTVVFLGKRGDVPELLGQLDLYVFSTTRDEGFGIAIAEGMSAGLPVIASDVPACREIIADGGGILVPASDPIAMAEAIQQLLSDPRARQEWASRAGRALEIFSVERCAREWLRSLTGEA